MYNDSHLLDFDRAGKITASLVAAIMGIDPNTSRQEAWRRIMGIAKERDNVFMQAGNDIEQEALENFEVESGILITPGRFIPHPRIPWLGASPDALTTKGRPVEVKAQQKKEENRYTTCPDYYRLQVLTQIECCDADQGYFGCLVCEHLQPEKNVGFWWETIPADKKYFREVICKELEMFYNEYVVKNVIPPRRSRKNGTQV